MKKDKKPKEVKPPVVHTDGPGDPPKCPVGQIWDSILEKCVDDIG